MKRQVTDGDILVAFNRCSKRKGKYMVTGEDIAADLKNLSGIIVTPSTIRGRLIRNGTPLGKQKSWWNPSLAQVVVGRPIIKQPKIKTGVKVPPKTNKFADGSSVWVVDSKTLDTMSQDKLYAAPGINPSVTKLAGNKLTVAFTDNNGFVHVMEDPNIMFNDAWLIDKPIIKQITARPMPVSQSTGYKYPSELESLIPAKGEFLDYVERDTDVVLAMHYRLNKFPITQGKQGTGKTRSHAYFAMSDSRPFLLLSCYEDFKLPKLFGDKTIQNGSIVFQESLFTRAIQHPSLILFDEINAVSQANTFDFHALLQNRCLFIKDADNGNGKMYTLHPDCKIGFSQNPKSAKYIGGQVRASNFLGRCTYITYPEFDTRQLKKAVSLKFSDLPADENVRFTTYYNAVCEALEKSGVNVDISIRQLFNAIELFLHGMDLEQALEGGITSITEAISNPKAKEALNGIAKAVWKDLFVAGKNKQ